MSKEPIEFLKKMFPSKLDTTPHHLTANHIGGLFPSSGK
jgi:hypothetical protein